MRYRLLALILLSFVNGMSQGTFVNKKLADNYFNNFYFHKAIPIYEKLVAGNPSDKENYLKLATIYDHLNDSRNAERCYGVLVKLEAGNGSYLLNYALALARNGKYGESASNFRLYHEINPGDPRGEGFSAAYGKMENFYRDSDLYTISRTSFSGTADDFGPAYFGKSVVFASDRGTSSRAKFQYNWTQSPFLDLYLASPESGEVVPFAGNINSAYHEGPVTFSANLDTIIFTRSNYYRSHLHKNSDGVNKLGLFRATWDPQGKQWQNITPVELNNDEYSVEHPALSPDGKELYFASDRPGGFGGLDLYVSKRVTDSVSGKKWSEPVNLGAVINTPGNEVFPFVDSSNNLWFASNGLPGLGGLDIFVANRSATGFGVSHNPGYPMNTRFDDFGYITDSSGQRGFLSSDRNNAIGNDDIYFISKKFHELAIRVTDSITRKVLPLAHLEINGKEIPRKKTASRVDSPYSLTVNPFQTYVFKGKDERYGTKEMVLTGEQLKVMDTLSVPLRRNFPLIQVRGHVYTAMGSMPVKYAAVTVVNRTGQNETKLRCDSAGIFSGELEAEAEFLIETSGLEGKGVCNTAAIGISTRGIQRDSTLLVSLPVYCEGDVITLETIYYDLDKYNIRADASAILDKLVRLLETYPAMKIEIRSHTDSRGSESYNFRLSENRAKSVVAYLNSKGIAGDRLEGKGYGKSMLINNCKEIVPCSEEEHQLNRRTEFRIVKIK